MLEIMTVDRAYWRDASNPRSESPFQQRRRSLATTFRGDLNSAGHLRVLERESAFLPDHVAGELCRDWASRDRRKRLRVITIRLLCEFARVALTALRGAREITGSKRERKKRQRKKTDQKRKCCAERVRFARVPEKHREPDRIV